MLGNDAVHIEAKTYAQRRSWIPASLHAVPKDLFTAFKPPKTFASGFFSQSFSARRKPGASSESAAIDWSWR
jgi:hypothetical protein